MGRYRKPLDEIPSDDELEAAAARLAEDYDEPMPIDEAIVDDGDPLERMRNKAQALHEMRIRRCRTDLVTFIETCVRDDHGTRLKLAPMHRQWIAHTQWAWERGKRACIMAHFGSGKTSSFAVPLLAWLIGRNPQVRIKVVCNDDDSSTKRTAGVKKILEDPAYQTVFPHVHRSGSWTGHECFVERKGNAIDPTIQARGVLTDGIGGRCDVLLGDDLVDQKKAMQPGLRDKITAIVEQTWMSRLEPDGKMLVIGTPWHQGDVLNHLTERKDFVTLVQSVSDDCTAINQEIRGASAQDLAGYPLVASE